MAASLFKAFFRAVKLYGAHEQVLLVIFRSTRVHTVRPDWKDALAVFVKRLTDADNTLPILTCVSVIEIGVLRTNAVPV